MKTYKAIENAKEFLKIQNFLINNNNIYIEIKDIEQMWFNFSFNRSASFLVVNDDTLNDFIKNYLNNAIYFEE